MNPLVLATPLIAMACLLVLMQRIETRMTQPQKVRVDGPRREPRTRAEATAGRSSHSPLLAAAPVALTVIAAVLAGGVLVRLAS